MERGFQWSVGEYMQWQWSLCKHVHNADGDEKLASLSNAIWDAAVVGNVATGIG